MHTSSYPTCIIFLPYMHASSYRTCMHHPPTLHACIILPYMHASSYYYPRYFMKFFTMNNKNIILLGHDNLMRYGAMEAGRYVTKIHNVSDRSRRRWAESFIPEGHLENGGMIIAAINYPRNTHWCFGSLTGVDPPVIQIRNDCMDKDDNWTICAATFMTNSLLQVHLCLPEPL